MANEVVERHRGNHRRVAECLKFQTAAVRGSLELKDHQLAFAVDAEQIDATFGSSEGTELLRHDEHVIGDRVDPGTQEPLQVCPLQDLLVRKRRSKARPSAHSASSQR